MNLYIIVGCIVGIVACFLMYMRHMANRQRRIEQSKVLLRPIFERVHQEQKKESDYLDRMYERAMHTIDNILYNESSTDQKKLVDLAHILSRGIYPVLRPCPDIASACCRTILLYSHNHDERRRSRFILYDMNVDDVDIRGKPLDEMRRRTIDRLIDTVSTMPRPDSIPVRTENPKKVHREPIENDSQNSHDSGVVQSTHTILRDLPSTVLSRDDIDEYIASCSLDDDTKAKALYALETLSHDDLGTGIVEYDALSNVWNATPHKDTVILQLASMIENGVPVCHSGKLGRLASVMDTGESTYRVVPVWVLRQYASNIAPDVRRDILETVSHQDRMKYDTTGDDVLTKKMIDTFTTRMQPHMKHAPEHIRRLIVDEYTTGF